jgi:hypothetical protein
MYIYTKHVYISAYVDKCMAYRKVVKSKHEKFHMATYIFGDEKVFYIIYPSTGTQLINYAFREECSILSGFYFVLRVLSA